METATEAISTAENMPRLSSPLKYLMAVGCGVIVANIYYCQPLLGELARTFHTDENAASVINICSQLGYGLGLFLIVPLGDKIQRRRLILWMHIAAALSLLGAGFCSGIYGMYFFSILIGVASTACQVFIPLAATLAEDHERGNVVGIMMGGLLTGVLLSRTLSGFVAQFWGWRTIYFIGCGLMLVMMALLWRMLPNEKPSFKGSYKALMLSLLDLIKQQPIIRESALIGAFLFAAISAFWATMAFFLEKPPYQYSLSVIGLFGVIGAGGAMVSPFIGKIIDRKGPLLPMRIGVFMMLAGYLILFVGSWTIAIIIAGIMLLDMGLQATHVPNLSRNYELLPEARTRLNTIYMTAFFIGGTIGSTIGSIAWNIGGWSGVCASGLIMVLLGGSIVFRRVIIKSREKKLKKA